tara:strand:- start:53 stop:247 length:195 start_codon:yes stop_codon:yes gene_type:complete
MGNLKLGQNARSLNSQNCQIFKVIGFTAKRVVCREIGRDNGRGLELYTREFNKSYHSLENLRKA